MKCKWCSEEEVNEGKKCQFCGTFYGEDRPRRIEILPPKAEITKKRKTRDTSKS